MVSGLQYFWKEVFLFFHFCSSVYTSFFFLWMLSRFSVYCWFSATSLWCVLLLNFLCFFSSESTECFKSQIYNFYQIWRNFGHSFLSSPIPIFLRYQIHIFETTWYFSIIYCDSLHLFQSFSLSLLLLNTFYCYVFKFTNLFFFSF